MRKLLGQKDEEEGIMSKKSQEEKFSIHVRAWGAGAVVWVIGFTSLLLEESLWFGLFYPLLIPLLWIIWTNEKLPGGFRK